MYEINDIPESDGSNHTRTILCDHYLPVSTSTYIRFDFNLDTTSQFQKSVKGVV